MEEQEETTSPQESRQNTVDDGGEADTEETPGDSVDSGPAVAVKAKGSGVPPLSDSEDDSTRVLMPIKEPYR